MKLRVLGVTLFTTCLVLAQSLWAQGVFPGAGTDSTTSLGQFTIVVNPTYQPALTGAPGYDGSGRLTSPLLYDPTTTINRSAPLPLGPGGVFGPTVVGSGASALSVSGSGGTFYNVTQGSTSIPNGLYSAPPPGYVTPALHTDSVITNISSFNLANGGVSVTAGSAAPGLPPSLGQVTSLAGTSNTGTSTNDFPAKSFFDVFVDVTVPGLGSGGSAQVFTNASPYSSALTIANSSISSFPPVVIYTHGNSSAVPLVFATNDPALGAVAGDIFGILTLAGHGVGYTNSNGSNGTASNGPSAFEAAYSQMTPMPALPQYTDASGPLTPTSSWAPNVAEVSPEPSTIALVGAFAVAAGATWYRRRSRRQPGS